jgi:hypothetical protein
MGLWGRGAPPVSAGAVAAGALSFLLLAGPARADEGMWTFDAFPAEKVRQAYGFAPDAAWLDHVRLSSVRLAGGCSAAFVSGQGLVQTNHHCARHCIQQLSTAEHNTVENGFYAATAGEERRCPDMEANQLTRITDVTDRIRRAIQGRSGAALAAALKAAEAEVARDCASGNENLRCDVVELYHGGAYHLYRYRRLLDVRLVFAPEDKIAFFGGDPDNFEFPRYDLDVSYLRVYGPDGRPLDTRQSYLSYAAADAAEGELVFTSGNPGHTDRLATVAELEFMRDVSLPRQLLFLAEMRGILLQMSAGGGEAERIARDRLFGLENSYKARLGQFQALVDPTLIESKRRDETMLRARVAERDDLQRRYGGAWDAIAAAMPVWRRLYDRFQVLEAGRGLQGDLFAHARLLLRYGAEQAKPDGERLPEFTAANFPGTRHRLLAAAPVYPELERVLLRASLTYLRRVLGPDDPLVRRVFGGRTAEQVADAAVAGSRLGDPAVRRRLLEGGPAVIAAADDPMLALARLVDAEARAVRQAYEDTVEAVRRQNATAIAQARFALYGTSVYPDATFSPRLSYGTVAGWQEPESGRRVAPFTTMGGAYERATGAFPFALPQSWLEARGRIDPATRFNMATTNDIIGGNSGSPVVNRQGEVVGLIFDGNIHSLGGDFGYDAAVNRAVAVSVGALREALAKIYGAGRLVRELDEK